ncbi:sepiapterin reductase-like [Neosynchiropus ocellatus]
MQADKSADLGRALCIITGASRGFGRAAAKVISPVLKPGSAFVLAARSAEGLRTLKAELAEADGGRGDLVVCCVAADLARMDGVESVLKAAKETFVEGMDHILLINNAASLGDVSRYFRSFTDMADVDAYLSFNVSSALCLTAGILRAFPKSPNWRRTVINISSICTIKPYPSWVLYCSGKAARDMMFKVLAEEEPDVRVLNYSPGPLDTDMMETARTLTADPGVKDHCTDITVNGKLLTCETSCAKMLKLLLEDSYASGAHVDIYDP